MIRLRQIKINVKDSNVDLKELVALKLNIRKQDIINLKINKKSIDARKKENIFYVYEIDIELTNEKNVLIKNKSKDIFSVVKTEEVYKFIKSGTKELKNNPIIVGSGPAGLFCAYLLVENGYHPIIIERGEKIEDRVKTVEYFFKTGILNPESNIQFGEGGAGTFSDGKLNTLVKDKYFRIKKIFEILVENGAPKEILYENKPHIGTDLLRKIIINIRNKIISLGGVFKYNTCLTNLIIEDNKLKAIELNHQEIINCEVLVLAIGHSARDTFKMLYDKKINLTSKPFAVGIRIQHQQKMIDKAQFGNSSILTKASYKLVHQTSDNRAVYTFCMCPGGYVINSSSEFSCLVINGMSNYDRESENANSAIVVTVSPSDFGYHPLDGIKYQKQLEKASYNLGNGKIPIQLYKDYKNNVITRKLGTVKPIFKGDYIFANLNTIFPNYINKALIEAIDSFGNKIKGFNQDDAIIAAIESRTSSPIRINRNSDLFTNIEGIYPCGEGSGYAGGITTSAIDGIKVAESIAKLYK